MSGTRSAGGAICPPAAACSGPAAGAAGTARLDSSPWPLLLLAFLAADGFVRVLDALALVGLGRTVRTDLGGDLADALTVGATDRDQGRPLAGDLDVLWDRIGDVVAVAELQVQRTALHRGAVADAVNLKRTGEAGRNTDHHVVDQRPGRAPHRPRALAVILRRDRDVPVGDRRGDLRTDGQAELALAATDIQ